MSEAAEPSLAPRVGEAMVWNTLVAPLKAALVLLKKTLLDK